MGAITSLKLERMLKAVQEGDEAILSLEDLIDHHPIDHNIYTSATSIIAEWPLIRRVLIKGIRAERARLGLKGT